MIDLPWPWFKDNLRFWYFWTLLVGFLFFAEDFAAAESKVEEQAEAAWSEAVKNQLAAKKHRQLLDLQSSLQKKWWKVVQKTIEIFQVFFWETPDLSNHKDLSFGWLGMAGSFCLPKKPASDGFTGWEMSWKSKRGGVWNGSMPWRWRSVRQGIGWINTCTLVHQLGALEAIWVTQNPGFQSITIENQCFLVSEEALQCWWRAWVMQPCCHVVMLGNWNIGCHAGGTGRGGTRKSSERLSKGLVVAWGQAVSRAVNLTLKKNNSKIHFLIECHSQTDATGGAPSRASRSWKCLASKNDTHLERGVWRGQMGDTTLREFGEFLWANRGCWEGRFCFAKSFCWSGEAQSTFHRPGNAIPVSSSGRFEKSLLAEKSDVATNLLVA